jgi:hypothetical protein
VGRLSDVVGKLRFIERGSDFYFNVIGCGVSQVELDRYIANRLLKSSSPSEISVDRLRDDISFLFGLGGVISGGCALAFLHNTHRAKDVDFYFNDEVAFVKAYLRTYDNPLVDVCFYFDEPHELHDMSLVMCNIYSDRVETTPQAQLALDSGVSELYPENVIYPDRTIMRIIKYHKRTGVRFRGEQVLFICSIFGVDQGLCRDGLGCCV